MAQLKYQNEGRYNLFPVNQTNFIALATSSGVTMAGEAQVVSFTPMPIPFSSHRNCLNITVSSTTISHSYLLGFDVFLVRFVKN